MEKIIQEIKKIEINTYVLLQLKECIDESVKERIENNVCKEAIEGLIPRSCVKSEIDLRTRGYVGPKTAVQYGRSLNLRRAGLKDLKELGKLVEKSKLGSKLGRVNIIATDDEIFPWTLDNDGEFTLFHIWRAGCEDKKEEMRRDYFWDAWGEKEVESFYLFKK